MSDSDPQREKFELTLRGRVGERLQKLWRQVRNTEPDLDEISEALDQTTGDEEARLATARQIWGL